MGELGLPFGISTLFLKGLILNPGPHDDKTFIFKIYQSCALSAQQNFSFPEGFLFERERLPS